MVAAIGGGGTSGGGIEGAGTERAGRLDGAWLIADSPVGWASGPVTTGGGAGIACLLLGNGLTGKPEDISGLHHCPPFFLGHLVRG